ncbi:MAG: tetratricopeptide repeat protein [Gammaproteobacteria bacterium]|nr:tetratricopeptide repeat protein [Gammaproteobacteria bacterium]
MRMQRHGRARTGIVMMMLGGCLAMSAVAEEATGNENLHDKSILQGNYAASEKALTERLNANPNDPYALLNLAVIYRKTGREEMARDAYQRVLAQRANPYVVVASDEIKHVKTVAKNGLGVLTED